MTLKRSLTFLMSSRSSCANAMLRSAVTDVLNRVAGAANGAAMVRPPRARRRVFTIVATVVGIRLTSCHGRDGEPHQPTRRDLKRAGTPRALHRFRRRHVGFDAAQLRQQVGAGHPVHRGVMDLRHHRQQAARARVGVGNALDHPHLPQRPVCDPVASDAMCPQISASSRRPPGAGRPMRSR